MVRTTGAGKNSPDSVMTRVIVNSGICGFTVNVSAEKNKDKSVRISLDTECEMVQKMRDDISRLDMQAAFTGLSSNPVYRSAGKHLKHVACPVPSAILKAVEVELGVCLPKDVNIVIINEKGKT